MDDITMNAYDVKGVRELMKDREKFGEKWAVTWKKSKDACMVRGNLKGMKQLRAEMKEAGFDTRTETKLLGE